jgi:hypothetical protein
MKAGDHQRAAEICAEIHREESGKVTGKAILAAGARARMSADAAGEVPEPTGFAAKVLAAGKKARRPTGSDE